HAVGPRKRVLIFACIGTCFSPKSSNPAGSALRQVISTDKKDWLCQLFSSWSARAAIPRALRSQPLRRRAPLSVAVYAPACTPPLLRSLTLLCVRLPVCA